MNIGNVDCSWHFKKFHRILNKSSKIQANELQKVLTRRENYIEEKENQDLHLK
jgi:hypothetical protein